MKTPGSSTIDRTDYGSSFTQLPHTIDVVIGQCKIALVGRFEINPKTVAKWKRQEGAADSRMGPKELRSSVLTVEEPSLHR
jgi:hypothetical protein